MVEGYTVNERYDVIIHIDSDPEDPREWDNMGTIATWHRRYNLGDIQPKSTLYHKDVYDFQEGLEENKDIVWLPVYMYDHSGIVLNTTGFSCPWDSGLLGFIYVDRNDLGPDCNLSEEIIKNNLKQEIETYNCWLGGDVYGYTISELGEEVDSCWGYYGMDDVKSAIKDSLVHLEEQRNKPSLINGCLGFLQDLENLERLTILKKENSK